MHKGILPCFWRAPTDNDKGGEQNSYFTKWKAANLDNLIILKESCKIQNVTDHLVKVTVFYVVGIKGEDNSDEYFNVDLTYSIHGSGDVIMQCNVKPSDGLPPLPRVGVEFLLDKSMDQIKWYGRGPFECYPDRKAGAHLGVYESNVGEMHVPYIVPGECSGRTDVRWVSFQNKDGVGIFASMYGDSPPMQMNASYYSTAELHRATHDHELIKGDVIEVCFSSVLLFVKLIYFFSKFLEGSFDHKVEKWLRRQHIFYELEDGICDLVIYSSITFSVFHKIQKFWW